MAKDFYNQTVRLALEKEGWTITHDPYYLKALDSTTYAIDFGAERLIAAEKGNEKIAIEVKNFLTASIPHEFHQALGQYLNYQLFLNLKDKERKLYLAVPIKAYETFFTKESTQLILDTFHIQLIIFNPEINTIETWLEN